MDETGEISAHQQDPFSGRKADSRFACNICLDPVSEPVVTQCGHLYCWPCLYRWLEPGIRPEEAFWNSNESAIVERPINESRRCCPVCKSPCSVPTLVPIYVRNEPSTPISSRKRAEEKEGEENDESQATGDSIRNEPSENRRSEQSTILAEDPRHDTPPPEEHEMPLMNDSPPEQQLRQRLRFRSRDSEISYESIPSRPSANSPSTRSHTSSSAAVNNQSNTAIIHRQQAYRTPLSPNPHNRASLSHGLLLLFQQALNGASSSDGVRDEDIPSLHRRDEANQGRVDRPGRPQDDHSTEFLSRLLLILGSFVILCLLIF